MENYIFYYIAVDNHTGEVISGSLGTTVDETTKYANEYRQLEANDEHERIQDHPDKYGYSIEPLTEAQYYELVGEGIL